VRSKSRPIVVTVAASDPILLAVAHGEFALTSGDRATGTSTVDSGRAIPRNRGRLPRRLARRTRCRHALAHYIALEARRPGAALDPGGGIVDGDVLQLAAERAHA
jgi:hypothetical protein